MILGYQYYSDASYNIFLDILGVLFCFYKEYLIPMNSRIKGIFLSIEQNCEKLDYEDIQYKVRLKMPHLSNHLQVLIQK